MAVFQDEFKQSAKEFGKGSAHFARASAKGAWRGSRKHKWIPAAAGGYVLGVKGSKYGDVQRGERAEDKHPYGGYYG